MLVWTAIGGRRRASRKQSLPFWATSSAQTLGGGAAEESSRCRAADVICRIWAENILQVPYFVNQPFENITIAVFRVHGGCTHRVGSSRILRTCSLSDPGDGPAIKKIEKQTTGTASGQRDASRSRILRLHAPRPRTQPCICLPASTADQKRPHKLSSCPPDSLQRGPVVVAPEEDPQQNHGGKRPVRENEDDGKVRDRCRGQHVGIRRES